MGDKAEAKRHLEAAGVPVIPGVDDVADDDALDAAAQEIGLPILVKAVAGGGGKGMRQVHDPDGLADAIEGARREAAAAFGDPRVLIEKVVDKARHVEVQVFGDTHGDVVHLFERECSVQRRHQKIVEETPSPALDEDLRARMCAAATTAAKAVGYVGAGTVEMLLSAATGDFYFLEMNTRLQVEHPVTELVTGLDLVEWQIRVAAGEPLPSYQEEITASGHAIETRVYAEDPAARFLPQTGRVLVAGMPDRPGVRVDSGVEAGSQVTRHYDPMLAKGGAHGDDREEARSRLAAALAETAVLGVTTNVEHLRAVVEHPAFVAGDLTTAFLEDHLPDWEPPPPHPADLAAAVAAVEILRRGRGTSPWDRLGPWRLPHLGGWPVTLRTPRGEEHELTAVRTGDGGLVVADGAEQAVAVRDVEAIAGPEPAALLDLDVDGSRLAAAAAVSEGALWLHVPGRTLRFEIVPPTRHADTRLAATGAALVSPMPGAVAAVSAGVGDEVAAGQTLVVVEAMKMEHPVKAPAAGVVSAVHVAVGDPVDTDQPLVEVEPLAAGGGDGDA
jgi:acetyl/propionyl-CoA carboxylase alpha subunit